MQNNLCWWQHQVILWRLGVNEGSSAKAVPFPRFGVCV